MIFGNNGDGINDANEGNGQFVLRDAYLDLNNKDEKGMGNSFKIGFTNFSGEVNPGTALVNHFSNTQWMGHSYGLVGWGGSQKQVANSGKGSGATYRNSISRYWVQRSLKSRTPPTATLPASLGMCLS